MIKGNRVKIKNITVDDYFALEDTVRETIEMFHGEEGIVLNDNAQLIRVGFSHGVEIIPAVLLTEIPQTVGVAVYKGEKDEIVDIKIFSTLKKAQDEIFEFENRDGLDKYAHEMEIK